MAYTNNINLVRALKPSIVEKIAATPHNLAIVNLPCPGSYAGHCLYQPGPWTCETCRCTVMHAFDGNFYCGCGRSPDSAFAFKCCSPKHGDAFLEFTDSDRPQAFRKMTSFREVNILVIGETGVGKSTWINGFYNYLTYATFEQAEEDDRIVYAIPSAYSMKTTAGKRKSYVGTEVEKDALKAVKTGKSVTQMTSSYVFKVRDMAIRLIDTPGIADTEGVEADKKNLQNMLDYLSNFDELHGICVLLKPKDTRLTNQFQYCFKELLRQLHVDACKNIVFCLTSSRPHDFEPSDVDEVLAEMIRSTELPIELKDDETIYCVDNESVSYLYGKKEGLSFEDSVRQQRMESWNRSAATTGRLLEHFLSTKPHKLKNTLSLNASRRAILTLCDGPLVDVSSAALTNIARMEEQRQRLVVKRQSGYEMLDEPLTVFVDSYEHRPLRRPRVVCKSVTCSPRSRLQVQLMRGRRESEPLPPLPDKQICCESCRAGHLRLCESIRLLTGVCKRCGCDANLHGWETYSIERVRTRTTIKRPPREAVVANTVAAVETDAEDGSEDGALPFRRLSSAIRQLSTTMNGQRTEKQTMLEIAAKLTQFLDKNSIVSHNDVFEEYIKMQLEVADDEERKRSLEALRGDYKKQQDDLNALRILSKVSDDLPRSAEDVDALITKLCSLKFNGPQLQRAMQVATDASTAAFVYHADRLFQVDLQTVSRKNEVQLALHRRSMMKVFEMQL